MAYTPYYAPYARPMGYYNPVIPQEVANMQNQQPQMPMMQNTLTNDMLFVLNETEATAYPVAPNNSVTLWDKNKDTVYIKSVNMQGVPSMRVLDYKERSTENSTKMLVEHECKCGNKFVRIDVFERLQADFNALKKEIEEMRTNTKVEEINSDE